MDLAESMNRLLAIAAIGRDALPPRVLRLAEFSLFDWMVVARAGADQPVSVIIRDLVEKDGGTPVATVIGGGKRLPARAAALANGTISHSLDYDDTHFAHIGHPSVAILPAALAAGEEAGCGGADVRDAFLLGAEASCRIGMVLGRVHYQRGFHQTATAGAFGAALAAGRIYGLTPCPDAPCAEPRRHPGVRPQVAIRHHGQALQRRHRRIQWGGSRSTRQARLRVVRRRHRRTAGIRRDPFGRARSGRPPGRIRPRRDSSSMTSSTSCMPAATGPTP